MSSAPARPVTLRSQAASPLSGTIRVPGDKSISHRALMLGAISVGETVIEGLLEGEDVLRTAEAMQKLGATVRKESGGRWILSGRGVGGLAEPDDVLDMGNAGTGARLLMGLLSSHPFTAVLTGDASLRSRPMARVTNPLEKTGARFLSRTRGRLPVTITGTERPLPLDYTLPVASAQVKSAILLAGLNTPGQTRVVEPSPSRDHTERMLKAFGADIQVEEHGAGRIITLTGHPELTGQTVRVPADPSSAAFPVAAALIVPGSHLTLTNVCINPSRIGLYKTLQEMGADIHFENVRDENGEPVADLVVRHSPLKGINVPAERAPSMIDEYPILSVVAAFASGETRMNGLGELRIKESDRLALMTDGLLSCGVNARTEGDDLIIQGTGKQPEGGKMIAVQLDHRIGMSFLVLGMATRTPVSVDDARAIDTSFPDFANLMNSLGARITLAPEE
ncbi:3-phosphoshikimate 1-carboxyvinyltransferase [Haematospirillum sp. H1815]|uniref:3-phosphoshikimate 1-carboxyvinyltransferase n=1 Tax=Haematospirillum sp. H1815 TaxID=2723108 RepID=UPI00143BA40A|nr:3-phosphoshikimate 1-carboxyvinyltransferase [Haematospirillum sp. H1815]NKD76909.1 3-phosphoshikimate 1-carboxyvinyltransferase [Haematospirillum sp. H1815]